MVRYIIKRLLLMIPVMLGVMLFVVILLSLARGDPAQLKLGTEATPEEIQTLRDAWGLDDPIYVRYFNYLKGVILHGDLGTSYTSGFSVTREILDRAVVTLQVALGSIIISLLFGVLFGVIAAVNQYSAVDNLVMVAAMLGSAMPNFWLALLLSLLFSLTLGWLPATGFGSIKHLIMPWIAMAVGHMAGTARQTRSAMLEVIRQDYIVTARAKGLSNFQVIMKHALRNSLIPIITSAGFMLGGALGGSLVIEQIFTIPGLGLYMVTAINQRDYPVVQGCVFVLSAVFGIIMLLVDIAYAVVDPRISARFKAQSAKKKVSKQAVNAAAES